MEEQVFEDGEWVCNCGLHNLKEDTDCIDCQEPRKAPEKPKRLTKEEKFKQEIKALRIVAVKITEFETFVLLQKKAVKNWKNIWVKYSGRPDGASDKAIKDFMLSKGQIVY